MIIIPNNKIAHKLILLDNVQKEVECIIKKPSTFVFEIFDIVDSVRRLVRYPDIRSSVPLLIGPVSLNITYNIKMRTHEFNSNLIESPDWRNVLNCLNDCIVHNEWQTSSNVIAFKGIKRLKNTELSSVLNLLIESNNV